MTFIHQKIRLPSMVVGDISGKLTLIAELPGNQVEVRCECGVLKTIRRGNFWQTKSCGCMRDGNPSHGGRATKLYGVWNSMLSRCNNPNSTSYHRYGGRGIQVCEEWHYFDLFQTWALANGYAEGLELDRRDNDGNYSPENCRWVTKKQNIRNRQITIQVEAFGECKSLPEWCEDARCTVPYSTLISRLRMGWDAERAITAEKTDASVGLSIGQHKRTARNKVCAFGEEKYIYDWAQDSRCQVSYGALSQRIYHGWNAEQAILTPKLKGGSGKHLAS